MELDEIKAIIKLKLEEGTTSFSTSDLEEQVRKKTGSVTSMVKKNIRFELAVCAFCFISAVLLWLMYSFVYVHLFCAATTAFCLVFSGYLSALYKKIIYYETVPASIKESLQQLIFILHRFTRLYFRITMGLLPVIFAFGFITGYASLLQQGHLHQFHWTRGLSFLIAAFIVSWPVLIYFLAKFYIRKLYGNYLLQLQQQLKDIENG